MKNYQWIENTQMQLEMVQKAAAEGLIAMDTEFMRETTFFPKIALIQLATSDTVWLLDPLKFKKNELGPFIELLTNPQILKVFHASFADQECLYWSYGVLADPVMDTSIAAALCGMGDNVGLGKLVSDCLDIRLPKGRARAKWLDRPLPLELEEYAAEDVRHLPRLAAKLKERLVRLDRWDWVLSEGIAHPSDFDPTPEEIAEKMGRTPHLSDDAYSVLFELVKWREARVRQANLPRPWVASNETLLALARVCPKSLAEIKSLRGLGRGEVEREGQKILEAVQKGLAQRRDRPRFEWTDTVVDNSMVSFIMTYVNLLAEEKKIAPRYLLTTASATRLMHTSLAGTQDWKNANIMSEKALGLIGKEIAALLNGECGLVFRKGRLEVAWLSAEGAHQ